MKLQNGKLKYHMDIFNMQQEESDTVGTQIIRTRGGGEC